MLVLASILLAACQTAIEAPVVSETEAAPEETQPAEAEPAERATLKVYVVDFTKGTTDVWLEEEVVPEFQKTHPNVDVEFIPQSTTQPWPSIMAAAVLTTVPLIIVFFFAQRYILESVVMTGLKG